MHRCVREACAIVHEVVTSVILCHEHRQSQPVSCTMELMIMAHRKTVCAYMSVYLGQVREIGKNQHQGSECCSRYTHISTGTCHGALSEREVIHTDRFKRQEKNQGRPKWDFLKGASAFSTLFYVKLNNNQTKT
jgi:hypothetical protein